MSDFNTFEFVVDERPEGKRKALKFWGRFGLIAFIAAWVIVSLCTKAPSKEVDEIFASATNPEIDD